MGGAYALRRTPDHEIMKLRLEMEEKRLKSRLDSRWQAQFQPQIDRMKVQIEAAHQRFDALRAEYRLLASNYAQSGLERVEEIKFQARASPRLNSGRPLNSGALTTHFCSRRQCPPRAGVAKIRRRLKRSCSLACLMPWHEKWIIPARLVVQRCQRD